MILWFELIYVDIYIDKATGFQKGKITSPLVPSLAGLRMSLLFTAASSKVINQRTLMAKRHLGVEIFSSASSCNRRAKGFSESFNVR